MPADEESVENGAHVYVVAPVAVSGVELPLHIATPGPALIVGVLFTDTVISAVVLQPYPLLPVTVYVVVAVGVATTDVPVADDKLPDGDQLYELAPLTVIVVLPPLHIATFGLVVSAPGTGFMVTVTDPGVEQPLLVPHTPIV